MGMVEMKENDVVKFFATEYGNSVGEALEKNHQVMAQVMVLNCCLGQEKSWTQIKMVMEQAFEAALAEQPNYLHAAMQNARENYFEVAGLAAVSESFDSGAAFFEVPLVAEQLSVSEKEAFDKEWKRFTSLYAKNPEQGKQILKQETDEMWAQEKQRMPSYLHEEVLERCREQWELKNLVHILQNITMQEIMSPPIVFDALPKGERDGAKKAWKEFLGLASCNDKASAGFFEAVEAQWEVEKKTFPAYLCISCVEESKTNWLHANFVSLIQEFMKSVEGCNQFTDEVSVFEFRIWWSVRARAWKIRPCR